MIGGDTLVYVLNKFGNFDYVEDGKFFKILVLRRLSRKECGNCGMFYGRDCLVYGKICFNCGRMNYFA